MYLSLMHVKGYVLQTVKWLLFALSLCYYRVYTLTRQKFSPIFYSKPSFHISAQHKWAITLLIINIETPTFRRMLTLYTSSNGSNYFLNTQRETAKLDNHVFTMVRCVTILVIMNISCLHSQNAYVFKLDCHHSSAKIPAIS